MITQCVYQPALLYIISSRAYWLRLAKMGRVVVIVAVLADTEGQAGLQRTD